MSYQSHELRPSNPILSINKKDIELNLINLDIHSRINEKYNNLEGMIETFDKKPLEVLVVIWLLIKDKSQYQYNIDNFYKDFYSQINCEEKGAELLTLLYSVINKSMPLVKNVKRKKDISKIKESVNIAKPCYARYYDSLAKRYGYTLEQFYQLTLRHVAALLEVIEEKSYDELSIQAELQGRKLKPRIKYEDISVEEEAENDKAALDALAELQKRYEKNKGNLNGR